MAVSLYLFFSSFIYLYYIYLLFIYFSLYLFCGSQMWFLLTMELGKRFAAPSISLLLIAALLSWKYPSELEWWWWDREHTWTQVGGQTSWVALSLAQQQPNSPYDFSVSFLFQLPKGANSLLAFHVEIKWRNRESAIFRLHSLPLRLDRKPFSVAINKEIRNIAACTLTRGWIWLLVVHQLDFQVTNLTRLSSTLYSHFIELYGIFTCVHFSY